MLNDPRIGEMKFILKVLRCWHKYNAEVNVGEAKTAEQRRAWGLSHQLLFYTECMVEGFIGLVDFICELDGGRCRLYWYARKISQVPLQPQ